MGNIVTCSKCGRLLATYQGELGAHRQIFLAKDVHVSVDKNALGEDLGWARCPNCRARTRVDAAILPGTAKT